MQKFFSVVNFHAICKITPRNLTKHCSIYYTPVLNFSDKKIKLDKLSDNPKNNEKNHTQDNAVKLTKRVIYSESTQQLQEFDLNDSDVQVPGKEIEKKESSPSLPKERLSKRLSRLGITSRRQAEKLISSGFVQVNNHTVNMNVLVDENSKIKLFTKHGEKVPVKQDTKLWVFNKPRGLICTHNDPNNRPTVFNHLKAVGFPSEHIISIGRLDYNSEGLLLLTNDGELSRSIELPESRLERTYRVRVYGGLDEEKLRKIQNGVTISGVTYGPYFAEIENKQTSNTWLKMRLTTGKNREIRRIMQKFSLRVNRLQRIRYGPYTLGNLSTGEYAEVSIAPQLKKLLYKQLENKMKEVNVIEAQNKTPVLEARKPWSEDEEIQLPPSLIKKIKQSEAQKLIQSSHLER